MTKYSILLQTGFEVEKIKHFSRHVFFYPTFLNLMLLVTSFEQTLRRFYSQVTLLRWNETDSSFRAQTFIANNRLLIQQRDLCAIFIRCLGQLLLPCQNMPGIA